MFHKKNHGSETHATWISALVALLSIAATALPARADDKPTDWPTSRGNPAHTGNIDGHPGPTTPHVRWVYKAQEHFIASPVPTGKTLYVSGLGLLNTPAFHALSMDANAPERVSWSKSPPFIKVPTVSSPAVVDGVMVFGDGMHQTDGATLYCLNADTGRPLWQYPMPGKLVHLEASPTVLNGRVFIGGGNAGVVSLDLKQATLDGTAMDIAAIQFLQDRKWTELNKKYEEEKKKDGDLAIPPTEDALPKPQPKLLWQKGKDEWHVDAAVDVIADKVLVASAYVDEDKAGKRVLLCLNAKDGSTQWETPLKVNPWGGPTVAKDLVLVGCSSIRFDKKLLPQAKGQIVAAELATGKVRWEKDVPGGVLSPVAVAEGMAIFTASDGKVRAWDTATGSEKWSYDAGAPIFAGAAVAGGFVYAADLKGVVHALKLADGKLQWKFDVPADPAVASPGTVFGSPVVHGGEIYLATNSLEEDTQAPLSVVCLSDQSSVVALRPAAQLIIDKSKRSVTVPCRVAPRKLPALKEIYPLEVVACWPSPQGQKAHETVVVFDVKPSDVHKALVDMGLKPGAPARGEGQAASGAEVTMSLMLPGFDGKMRAVPLEKAMIEPHTGKPLPALKWYFTGSITRQPDPNKPQQVYAADLTGTLISIFPVTDECVFQTNLTMKEEPLLKLQDNKDLLPEEGTPVDLVIQAK